MKYEKQISPSTCGVAAVRNCLSAFGEQFAQSTIRRITMTDKDGTKSKGIMRAVKYYGYDCREFTNKSANAFLQRCKRVLGKGNKLILLAEHEEHWISVVGYEGRKFVCIDPERRVPLKQLSAWCCNFQKQTKVSYFYGIEVKRIEN